jgi:hypothetical protein
MQRSSGFADQLTEAVVREIGGTARALVQGLWVRRSVDGLVDGLVAGP